MKACIRKSTTTAEIQTLVSAAVAIGATHVKVLRVGGQRSAIIPVGELIETYEGEDVDVAFGTRQPGLPFEESDGQSQVSAPSPAPAPSAREASQPSPESTTSAPQPPTTDAPSPFDTGPEPVVDTAPPKAKKQSKRKDDLELPKRTLTSKAIKHGVGDVSRGSGFVAFIDRMLLDTASNEIVEGFRRSRFTVNQAVTKVMEKFPAKNVISVKKIVKVRPRHLEKAKGEASFNEKTNRAPRWAIASVSENATAGRMILDLIIAGERDRRKIANLVAKKFGRDFKRTHRLVSEKFGRLHKKTGDKSYLVNPEGLLKRDRVKMKNLELIAKKKAAKAKKNK